MFKNGTILRKYGGNRFIIIIDSSFHEDIFYGEVYTLYHIVVQGYNDLTYEKEYILECDYNIVWEPEGR